MLDALLQCVFEVVGEAIMECFFYFLGGVALKGVEMVRDICNMFLGR